MDFIEKAIMLVVSVKLLGFVIPILLLLVCSSFIVILQCLQAKRSKHSIFQYTPPFFIGLLVVSLTIGLPITLMMVLSLFCKKRLDALRSKETSST